MTIDTDHLAATGVAEKRRAICSGAFWRAQKFRLSNYVPFLQHLNIKFSNFLFLKFAVSVLILAVLFIYIDLPMALQKLFSLSPAHLIVIVAILCLQLVLAAWRWHEILKMMGQSVSFRQSFDMFIAGAVGNLVMLTSLGGMSVRAFMLARRGTRLPVIAISLLIERFFVLAALTSAFLFSALAVKDQFEKVVGQLELASLLISIGIGAGFVSVFCLFCMSYGDKYIKPIWEHLGTFTDNPMRSVRLFLSSIAVLFVGFSAIAIIASSMGIGVPVLILFSVLPLISFLASLPVGFGGWGVREGSMVLGFSFLSVGAEDAIAVSLLYGLAGMLSIFLLALIVLPRLAKK